MEKEREASEAWIPAFAGRTGWVGSVVPVVGRQLSVAGRQFMPPVSGPFELMIDDLRLMIGIEFVWFAYLAVAGLGWGERHATDIHAVEVLVIHK